MELFNGPRRYKIYINDRPLYLCRKEDIEDIEESEEEGTLIMPYRGNAKLFLQCCDNLEKGGIDRIILTCDTPKEKFKSFKLLFRSITACGGLVENEKEEALIIFRRNSHDLPKGKIEGSETKKDCAIREVKEETGIQELSIEAKIGRSFHVFRDRKNRRVLKKNIWYAMRAPTQPIIAQKEEDIEWGRWVPLDECMDLVPMFPSIRDVLLQWHWMKLKSE